MVAATSELLGVGLYTPEEAALYARVYPRMLCRWLYGSAAGDSVLRPQIAPREERRVVTFLDFVQAMAVRAVRIQHHIPLQKIRQAINNAESEFGVDYPFARKHTTYLVGNDVVIRIGEGEYVQASGKAEKNRLITKVVELYMRDLGFSEKGLANIYQAYSWGEWAVDMNPKLRFGEPLVRSCGYSARALWEAFKAEGSFEAAAEAYGVKPGEVEAACRYFDHISPVPLPREPKAEAAL
jgi:uncharacterized protein (DUF433 family)